MGNLLTQQVQSLASQVIFGQSEKLGLRENRV
jgi:hypothetical protein